MLQQSTFKINVLDSLLQSHPQYFDSILKNKQALNVQIIYTQINRDKHNKPSFTNYSFNLNNSQYFYPASTVKMPVAVLALEKLNELKIPGLDRQTAMITDSSFGGQKPIYTHAQSPDARPSIEGYVKEIFLVSDNDAFNRLYEFLGQQYINDRLHKKGFKGADILHRLSVSLTEEQNRHTNAIAFYDTAGNIIYNQPPAFAPAADRARNTLLGNGYYQGGKLINAPFDFSKKNRFYLSDLHQVLRSLIFPEAVKPTRRFNLTGSDYALLYKYMSMYPGESKYPQYDTANYWDSYVKFLLHGSQKGALPTNIRIFNKVGDAYGFLTDVAYIVDFKTSTEFLLSATILCNSDGIFNDDHYDYETIGFPFMKNIGQVIYNYELTRKRKHVPDLGRFIFQYDK